MDGKPAYPSSYPAPPTLAGPQYSQYNHGEYAGQSADPYGHPKPAPAAAAAAIDPNINYGYGPPPQPGHPHNPNLLRSTVSFPNLLYLSTHFLSHFVVRSQTFLFFL